MSGDVNCFDTSTSLVVQIEGKVDIVIILLKSSGGEVRLKTKIRRSPIEQLNDSKYEAIQRRVMAES